MKWAPLLALGSSIAAAFAKGDQDAQYPSNSGALGQKSMAALANAQKKASDVFIVQFDDKSLGKRDLQSALDAVHSYMASAVSSTDAGKVPYKVRYQWDSQHIKGFSVRMSNPADAKALLKAPHVKSVRAAQAAKRVSAHPSGVPSGFPAKMTKKLIHKRDGNDGGNNTDTSTDTIGPTIDGTYLPHQMIGVDRLLAANITGSGIVVGIVDDGVDLTHPMLNGGNSAGVACSGDSSTCQVIGGKDLVGNDFDGSNDPQPSDNLQPDCPDDSNWGIATVGFHDMFLSRRSPTD